MKRLQYQRRKVKPEKNTWYVNVTNQHKHICTVIYNQKSYSEIQPLIQVHYSSGLNKRVHTHIYLQNKSRQRIWQSAEW